MATASRNQVDSHQSLLTVVQLFSAPGDGEETDLDGGTDIDHQEKKSTVVSIATRPWSDVSTTPSSALGRRKNTTRAYRFVQLERAMVAARLLSSNDDRVQFQNEYLESLQKDKFEQFLEKYYEKIRLHYEQKKKEQALKESRTFAFVDLEKNFLALDPTRDVKIVFLDDTGASSVSKSIRARSAASGNVRSSVSNVSSDAATEAFYAHRSRRLLHDQSRARDEITMFARRAAERLHERLPRMSSVQHRVKIIDDRDMTGKPDERTMIQLKHKRALSSINKRRHILVKMMTQTKKNQMKMEEQRQHLPWSNENTSCCRELLERASQIEQVYRQEQMRRPQTAARTLPNTSSFSSPSPTYVINPGDHSPPPSSLASVPFQDALSIYDIEKSSHVRVIRSTRPLTAPVKASWVNYC